MATCKDCFHVDACERQLRSAFPNVLDEEIKNVIIRDNNCLNFKNKADVVEVVRCKDCKYLFDYSPDEKPFCELFSDGYDHQFRPNPEDYCSRGQHRTPKERGGEK